MQPPGVQTEIRKYEKIFFNFFFFLIPLLHVRHSLLVVGLQFSEYLLRELKETAVLQRNAF